MYEIDFAFTLFCGTNANLKKVNGCKNGIIDQTHCG
jgi:hypothetical protein